MKNDQLHTEPAKRRRFESKKNASALLLTGLINPKKIAEIRKNALALQVVRRHAGLTEGSELSCSKTLHPCKKSYDNTSFTSASLLSYHCSKGTGRCFGDNLSHMGREFLRVSVLTTTKTLRHG